MAVTTTIQCARVVAPLFDRDPSPEFSDYVGKMQGAIPHPGANNCPEKGPGIEAKADREGPGTTLLYAHRSSLLLHVFTDGLRRMPDSKSGVAAQAQSRACAKAIKKI
jgi:hypothetical protein